MGEHNPPISGENVQARVVPSEPMASAKVDMMLDYIALSFYPTAIQGIGYMYVGYAPADEEKRAANEKKYMEVIMPNFEALLTKQAYLGDVLTIADFAFVGLAAFNAGNPVMNAAIAEGKFPKVGAYLQKLGRNPGDQGRGRPHRH